MTHPMTQLAQDVRTGQDRLHFWNFALPIITALAGGIFGKKNSQRQTSSAELGQMTAQDFQQLLSIPQIQDFLKLQQAQTLRNEPLNQAVSQLAFQLLPRHARQGISSPNVPTPPLSFSDMMNRSQSPLPSDYPRT